MKRLLRLLLCLAALQPGRGRAAPSTAPPPRVQWSTQIAPILYANCTSCHHPGGAAPFSLLTYKDAQRWASQLVTVTRSGYMPPWLPEHQAAAFADERRLTPSEIARIAAWTRAGMPQGETSKAPSPPIYSPAWQHGTPDLVLRVERPFLLLASGSDVFRNFVLPYPLKQPHLIRAVEIRPGAPEIVHHANILLDPTASFRRLHPGTWQESVPGMEVEVDAGNRFDPDSHFLFWKPDSPVLLEPAGQQWQIDPGTDLILNMHLKPSGRPERITAEIGLWFADADGPPTAHPMLLQLEHDSALRIPAGAHDFPVDDSLTLPVDVDLLGIYPHAHYLGKRLEAWATLPGGQREQLISIPDWDIDRQSVYRYQAPLRLPAGTVVHMHYTYDNSSANVHNPHDPPIPVHAGNRSQDEMAHLWLQVLPVHTGPGKPDARLLLEEAWMRSRLAKEPGDAIAEYNLAAALAGQARNLEAAALYRRLLAAHPSDNPADALDERARNSLGATLESAGDWQAARRTYLEDIAAHPSTCDARFNLARLDLRHNQPAEAEQQFRTLGTGCPEDASMHSGLGAALAAEDQPDAAQAEFEHALALDPRDYTALYNLGILALARQQPAQAAKLLSAALNEQPQDPDAHRQLAAAYAQTGRMPEAIAELRRAAALAPLDPAPHASLAQALAATGSLLPAIEEQKQALALDPSDADGWNNLGVLEARAGRTSAAREDFNRALARAPGHAQARANLGHLPPG